MQELIDWAASDPILKQVADSRRVYLLGHSRGAKVATLAAVRDTRVAAVCLVDPVDNTVYAPLGPGFPSAATALRNIPDTRFLPVAIVGTPAPQRTPCLCICHGVHSCGHSEQKNARHICMFKSTIHSQQVGPHHTCIFTALFLHCVIRE
jgi:pimeloyl-ACP methyl ester carboxylesterase